MSTSGKRQFTLTVDEVLREAFERLGGEPVLGAELASARRSLNIVITNLINKGILTFTLNNIFVTCSTSQVSYDLPTSVVDVLFMALRRDDTDREMTRINFTDYLRIPNKTRAGTPSQYMVDRKYTGPTVYIWQASTTSTDVLNILTERRIQDIINSNEDIGIPWRFMPVLASGLAFLIATKRIGIGGDRIALLKQQYDEELIAARQEDRDRADYFVSPKLRSI